MIRLGLIVLLVSVLPFTVMAQDKAGGYIHVSITCKSMFPGHIQVRDEVCKEPRSIDCEKARIRVDSKKCQQDRSSVECQEATSLLNSKFCLEGLIYDDRISQDEKLKVRLCKSSTGYGNVSVRNTMNGDAWTNYPLMTDGNQISFP